ncbi:ERMES complex subunit mmm1 [Coemansia sp. RSA 1939]|nr:ERMES complex subunit mmm1 [Coemansia sp. RSA 1939]KAJ2615189.1 ERMES complex subunit mmm1 [Coemansia sp. RSA 1804]
MIDPTGLTAEASLFVVAPTLLAAVVATASVAQTTETTLLAATAVMTAEPSQSIVHQSSWMHMSGIPAVLRLVWAWQPTFMHGFILGQFSMLVLLVMAIKYVLFEEPMGKASTHAQSRTGAQPRQRATAGAPGTATPTEEADMEQAMVQKGGFGLSKFTFFSRKQKEIKPSDAAEELAKIKKEILSRTAYDLVTHAPESCDWLTVFLAQVIAKFRQDAEKHDRLVRVISEALNGELRPSVIDSIRITQFSLGSDFLRITSARMAPSAGSLGMHAELDLELHDELTLGFSTRVLVNWPRQLVAALPVTMVVSMVKFVGTAVVEFDCDSLEPSITVSIMPNYVLEFDIQTLIGSKAKVQNLPMLTSVISRKLEATFAKELVMPNKKRMKIKHPFTPKTSPDGGASSSTSLSAANASKTTTFAPPAQQSYSANPLPRSPVIETNRPTSPVAPFVAELPPDYNTQLPPPHHLRGSTNSRAAANGAKPTAQGSIHNASPIMNVPARLYTPDESARAASHPPFLASGANQQQHQHQQHGRSSELSFNTASPQLRPVVGLSSGTSFGPLIANPCIISATGGRIAGMYNSPLFTSPSMPGALFPGNPMYPPPPANNVAAAVALPVSASNLASGTGIKNTGSVSGAAPTLSNRHSIIDSAESDNDELKVKDSVRQRVNRVLRTVNES